MKKIGKAFLKVVLFLIYLVLTVISAITPLILPLVELFFVVGSGATLIACFISWLGNDSTKMWYYGKLAGSGFLIIILCGFISRYLEDLQCYLERLLFGNQTIDEDSDHVNSDEKIIVFFTSLAKPDFDHQNDFLNDNDIVDDADYTVTYK